MLRDQLANSARQLVTGESLLVCRRRSRVRRCPFRVRRWAFLIRRWLFRFRPYLFVTCLPCGSSVGRHTENSIDFPGKSDEIRTLFFRERVVSVTPPAAPLIS